MNTIKYVIVGKQLAAVFFSEFLRVAAKSKLYLPTRYQSQSVKTFQEANL